MLIDSHLYEYAVVRYMPSVVRGEFINIGLLMMCKRRRWIRFRQLVDSRRLDCFRDTPHTPGEITAQLSTFEALCRGDRRAGELASAPVEERFRWLTAVRSACITTSRPHPGETPDLDTTFDRLFEELVV